MNHKTHTTMSIEQKYDLKRLHADCLAWCENPELKPWMVEMGVDLQRKKLSWHYDSNGILISMLPFEILNPLENVHVVKFAHFIGLDIEAYSKPRLTHKEAVERYLESVPEGGELIPGWVKETIFDGSVWAINGNVKNEMYGGSIYSYKLNYYFLRLDLKEGYEVEVQPYFAHALEMERQQMLDFANWCRIYDSSHPNEVNTIEQLYSKYTETYGGNKQ